MAYEIIYVCNSINNKNVREGELKILKKIESQLCFEFGADEMNIKKRFYNDLKTLNEDYDALVKLKEKIDNKKEEKKEEVKKTEVVDEGSSATAPADPSKEGHKFTGWDVEYDEITGDTTITATYENDMYTVTIKTYVNGEESSDGGTVAGAGTYISGKLVAIGATPNSGYTFDEWTSSDIVVPNSTNKTTSFEMPKENITIKRASQKSSFLL